MKNIDVYEALIENEDDGIFCISLVDDPAVEANWLAFAKAQQPLQFKVADEDEHILLGVIMRADFPIYRIGISGYEYYIKYSADTIAKMARKMLADNSFNFIDTQHNNEWVDGVLLEELFIKDVNKGIDPKGFESIENGSLFAKYRVINEEIWKKVKAGDFRGFSLEGYFTSREADSFQKQKNNNYNNQNKNMSLLERLKSILTEFKAFETKEGITLEVDGEELAVGQAVSAPNGEYHTDTLKVKVENGFITEIEVLEQPIVEEPMVEEPEDMGCKKKKMEEIEEPTEPTEEPIEKEPEPFDYEALQTLVNELVARIDALEAKMNEPCTLNVEETFKKIEQPQIKNRALEIAEAIKASRK